MTRALPAFLFLLFLAPWPADAGPDRVSILLGSHHTEDYAWEEANPGVFLTWEDGSFGLDYSLGAYRNSFGTGSVAAIAGLELMAWEEGAASAFCGAAWYPGNGQHFLIHAGDVVPLCGLQLRQGPIFAQLMPGKVEPPELILAFGLTFAIGDAP
jgi:ribosomal protein L24E